jgi:YggT family protein
MSRWATHPLYTLGMLYLLAMLVRAVLSWFPLEPGTPVSRARRWLTAVTEPVIAPFRKVIPPIGLFDISFLVAFLVVYLVTSYILWLVVV